jgi:N-acetylmuramoyl-L-alanine amidase
VTEIHHWVGPHYTRIVIGLTGETKFDTLRLSNPDRIVLDLSATRLSRTLAGMKFPVENGFLRQVRVGQFKQDVTRIVLDVDQVQDYFVFSLPNPFRLVVDVHGPEKLPAAESARTIEPEAKAPPKESPKFSSHTTRAEEVRAPSVPALQPSSPEVVPSKPKGAATASANEPPDKKTGVAKEVQARPAGPTQYGAQTLTRALGLKVQRIVIDPGHGGHDTGTIGPTGLTEKDVVLDVALRLAKLLRDDLGSEVVLTRDTDVFIPLEERTAIANEKAADLFISIHTNASRDSSARGIETYFMNFTSDPQALAVAARENATSQESVHELRDLIKRIALTEKVEESQEFASQIQREYYARITKIAGKEKNRGVKKAPFVVLIGANMPSILCETAFLSNPRDERLLKHPEFRQEIAGALYRGIARYAGNLGGVKVAQRVRPAD